MEPSEHTEARDSENPRVSDGVPTWQTAANIAKNIIGGGILSLPAGLAAGTGIFSGLLISLAFCAVMLYTFWTLGRMCEATGQNSYQGICKVLERPFAGKVMSAVSLLKTLCACTAYALVIGKNSEDLWNLLLLERNSSGFSSWLASRRGSWLAVLICFLLPLCLQKDMRNFAWTSSLGLLCEFGVVGFMLWRLLDGSYQPGGEFYCSGDRQESDAQVWWGLDGGPEMWTISPATLMLVSSMSTAFLAHYNAPKFYHQLRRRSSTQFFAAAAASFTGALLLYLTCMVAGYLTFGKGCAGNVLHNYSDRDPAAAASRLAMLVAVTCGFPFAFTCLRDSALSLCGLCCSETWTVMTFGLLTLIGALGCALDDLGALNSLAGAVLGSLITMVFPGLMLTWLHGFASRAPLWKVEHTVVGCLLVAAGVLQLLFGTAVVISHDNPKTLQWLEVHVALLGGAKIPQGKL